MILYDHIKTGELYFSPEDSIEELEQYGIYYIISKKDDNHIRALSIYKTFSGTYDKFTQDYDDINSPILMDSLKMINKKHYKNLIRTIFDGQLK